LYQERGSIPSILAASASFNRFAINSAMLRISRSPMRSRLRFGWFGGVLGVGTGICAVEFGVLGVIKGG
jgi:hypothetical protein